MSKKIWLFLPFIAVLSLQICSLAYGSEIVFPAAQIQQGGGSVSLFYGRTNQKLNLQVTDKDEIKVGANSYFSSVTNDLETDASGDSVNAKFIINPSNGFYYWLKAGSGSYEFEIPSDTVKNKLNGQERGWIFGAGLVSVLFPDTIVTPALAAGIGVNYSSYDLDNFRSGDGQKQKISNKAELCEIQAQVVISKKFSRFEPYGGMKVLRTYTALTDKESFNKVSGIKDTAGIFAGTRYRVYPKESIIFEISSLSETNITLGWNVEF